MSDDERLKELVAEFFTKYLDYTEDSESGVMFNPIYISCCRALKLEPLEKLLIEMKTLAGVSTKGKND